MNKQVLRQLNNIVASIEGNYREVVIEEVRDGIVSDVAVLVAKDSTGKRVVFFFDKYRMLSSIVRQINPNRCFKYNQHGIAQKNCYNLFLKTYKSRHYMISL